MYILATVLGVFLEGIVLAAVALGARDGVREVTIVVGVLLRGVGRRSRIVMDKFPGHGAGRSSESSCPFHDGHACLCTPPFFDLGGTQVSEGERVGVVSITSLAYTKPHALQRVRGPGGSEVLYMRVY